MKLHKINDNLSVAAQIRPTDVPKIATLGFKTIICNRPDGEEPGQTCFAEIEAAAMEHGLQFEFQPVVSGHMSPQDVSAFFDACKIAAQPVLAYCRTGTRCTILWAFSQVGRLTPEEIIETAKNAGYDISGLAPALGPSGQKPG
ncbi:MAG: TIGR01244 family sulfur transferase [Filomicrobium sp.]